MNKILLKIIQNIVLNIFEIEYSKNIHKTLKVFGILPVSDAS